MQLFVMLTFVLYFVAATVSAGGVCYMIYTKKNIG